MAGFESGLTANRQPSNRVQTSGINQLSSLLSDSKNGIQVGRVIDIILNKDYPNIEKYGGLNAIGTIFFSKVGFESTGFNQAKPFFPQITSYPLINELILIFQLSDTSIGINSSETSYYYINSINLWNAPHHNGYPNLSDGVNDLEQIADYKSTSQAGGEIRKVNDSSTEIDFNSPANPTQNTFIERSNIHPLQSFTGDNIFQGRWGNSIRLGSTTRLNNGVKLNDWSEVGDNGDPITIIRNGQPLDATNEGWVPIVEDINKDLSSIYLTSTQKLKEFKASSTSYKSYTTQDNEVPTPPNDYNGKQVIINSGRLLFNTNEDHIMLSSQRTISFNAKRGFNFDTPSNFVVEVGTTIKLGSKEATEPLVKGNTLFKDLDFMLAALIQLIGIIEYSNLYPGGIPAPDSALSTVSSTTKEALKNIKKNLKNILSKTSKTI